MSSVHDALADAGSSSELSSAEVCSVSRLSEESLLVSGRLPRLMKRAEFVAVSSGRRVHSSRMTVQILERRADMQPGAGAYRGPRFGLTVTKKTANAVGRNRIRRRLRALLCNLRPFWLDADIDFVIIGRAEMLTASADVISSDLKRAFSSPSRQGNPRNRNSQSSHFGRGKGGARSSETTKPNPTE